VQHRAVAAECCDEVGLLLERSGYDLVWRTGSRVDIVPGKVLVEDRAKGRLCQEVDGGIGSGDMSAKAC